MDTGINVLMRIMPLSRSELECSLGRLNCYQETGEHTWADSPRFSIQQTRLFAVLLVIRMFVAKYLVPQDTTASKCALFLSICGGAGG